MSRVSIPINGITTTGTYEDGDCLELVNLRKKNGVLRPVTPRGTKLTLTHDWDKVFLHQLPSGGENWIGVSGTEVYWIQIDEGEECEAELIASCGGMVSKILQIGTWICIASTEDLRYLLWKNSKYVCIDGDFRAKDSDIINLPSIEFKTDTEVDVQPSSARTTEGVSIKYIGRDGHLDIRTKGQKAWVVQDKFNEAIDEVIGMANKLGYMTSSRLLCVTYRLMNGEEVCQRFYFIAGPGSKFNKYYDVKDTGWAKKILSKSSHYTQESLYTKEGDKILSRFFGGLEDRRDYGSSTQLEFDTTTMPPIFFMGIDNIQDISDPKEVCPEATYIPYCSLKMRISGVDSSFEIYEGIIESVRIYISDDLEIFSRKESNEYSSSMPVTNYRLSYVMPKKKKDDDIDKMIGEELENLYLLKEIRYEDIVNSQDWIDLDLKEAIGEELYSKEKFRGSWKYWRLRPECINSYNGRLLVADYVESLYNGFGCGEFNSVYDFGKNKDNIDGQDWIIGVRLYDSTYGESYVVRRKKQTEGDHNMGPFLYYPDSRARRMDIYIPEVGGGYRKYAFKLTKNDALNISFYVDKKFCNINLENEVYENVNDIEGEFSKLISRQNIIKTSSQYWPMVFPDELVESVGSGRIIWMGENRQPVATENAGTQPMFVGTTEGVHAMIVDQTGNQVFRGSHGVADIVPTSNTICKSKAGVVFVSEKGAYIISSEGVVMISKRMEDRLIADTGTVCPNYKEFLDFISGLKSIVYDPKENEIIFSSEEDYNYVFSADSGMWYISLEKVDAEVVGCYPYLYTIEGSKVKDYSIELSDTADVHFATRPFYLGDDTMKRIDRAVLRAQLNGLMASTEFEGEALLQLRGSLDGIHMAEILTDISLRNSPRGPRPVKFTARDIDSGPLVRCNYRSFSMNFAARINSSSLIQAIDISMKSETNTNKLR